jgi:anti-sigma regulatory factor (Ser/Thr protein kinase)
MNAEIASERVGVEPLTPVRRFTVQLSSTRHGASRARHLAVQQLADWGWPYDSAVSRDAALLVAELAANAVIHGRLPGRDFRLGLTADGAVLRIEVTDARAERPAPAPAALGSAPSSSESGRGLLIVEALAARWGSLHCDPLTKTVWCELAIGS